VTSKFCYVCEKEITSKNEIGLNKKLLGRKTAKFYCIDCLAEYYDLTADELLAKADEFKLQGCALFE
jgi:hypothetical protein